MDADKAITRLYAMVVIAMIVIAIIAAIISFNARQPEPDPEPQSTLPELYRVDISSYLGYGWSIKIFDINGTILLDQELRAFSFIPIFTPDGPQYDNNYPSTINTYLPPGNYTISMSFLGYQPYSIDINLNQSAKIVIRPDGELINWNEGLKIGYLEPWPNTFGQIMDKWGAIDHGNSVYRFVMAGGETISVNDEMYYSHEIGDSFGYKHWVNITERYYRNETISFKWIKYIGNNPNYRLELENETVIVVNRTIYDSHDIYSKYSYGSFDITYKYADVTGTGGRP